MTFWIINCLVVLLLSILFAGVIIPQILLISFRKSLFDTVDERKIHQGVVPRLGGLAFMPVVFFTIVLTMGVGINFTDADFTPFLWNNLSALAFFSCAVMMLYIVGMADDLVGVRYRAKFVVQIIASIFMILGGVWITNFYNVFGVYAMPTWIGMLLFVLVTVFIINAINLIDGVDGLASGLSSIAFLCYGVIYFMAGKYIYSLLSFASLGVLIPFFYYNVFGRADRQKKIFMGDTGSLTIGIMLSFLSVGLLNITEPKQLGDINMFAVAFSPLVIPCFDVVRVFGERIIRHQHPFMPDKRHIHHKLLALGMSQRRVMVYIVITSTLFTIFNVLVSQWININVLILFDIVVWAIGMYLINKRIRSIRQRRESPLTPKWVDAETCGARQQHNS